MLEDKSDAGAHSRLALKAAGFAGKTSDEVMHSDLTSYGAEWVGIAYSTSLWEAIRMATFLPNKLNQIEVPAGHASIYLPIESTDPVWYTVTENSEIDDTSGNPIAKVTSSQATTGRVQLTLNKMGCRVLWSGELEEDSLIPFASQLRKQLTISGAEYLEHAIIDGDTQTSSSTNINNAGGAIVTGAAYLMFNGFRKSPLVTTTANSRAAGTLEDSDYLETLKLMGTAGINAMDNSKVFFLQDVHTNWKALELAQVKTRDVYSQPTIESGKLTSIWGYPVYTSPQMHRRAQTGSLNRKCTSAGYVNETTYANNLYGAILAVRPDQWTFGWRRRMTLETTRIPNADTTEIVAWLRCGLIQRDTEASAISYGIVV
jgi:HK97 family phage major capsid protein